MRMFVESYTENCDFRRTEFRRYPDDVDGRGAAEIRLRTVGGTTGENLAVDVAGYTLTIGGLQPYPMSSDPIPQGDYRVTLVVTRD